jgi:uncharacterized protein YlxW (UPF0749 family)
MDAEHPTGSDELKPPSRDDTAATDDAAEPTPSTKARRRAPHVRAAALIGVLTAALGFAIAVQVHANSQSDSLSSLREDDLIGILDNQNDRADRLRQQISQLQTTLRNLQDTGNGAQAAREQAEQEQQTLEILLGTIPATGSGVEATITDPNNKLQPEQLLDVIEELRGAGAEAIQFGSVRIGTNSAFTSVNRRVAVDGVPLQPPYTVLAIGEPGTLDTALNIPGGVASVLRAAGGNLTVAERATVTIDTVRTVPAPKYAKPSGH